MVFSSPRLSIASALPLAALFASTMFTVAATGDVLACCGTSHSDCPVGSFPDLSSALAYLRSTRTPGIDMMDMSTPPRTLFVSGDCILDRTLALGPADSGLVIRAAPHGLPPVILGGQPVFASNFTPVTDPAVIAQMAPGAAGNVMQLNLTALGVDPGPAPIAGELCRRYAEGLPEPHGGSMPGGAVNSPPGLELFVFNPAGPTPAVAAPLDLARWPDEMWSPYNWSSVRHLFPGALNERTFGPDAATLNRTHAWAQQFQEDPGSIYVHQYYNAGWADMHWRLEGLHPGANMTFGGCGNMSVGEHQIRDGNWFYSYNILAELDREGEYYINRTSGMLYVWLPSTAPSTGLLGYVSVLEDPLVHLTPGTANVTMQGLTLAYGRGVGLLAENVSDITVLDSVIQSVGLMAVNMSGGWRVSLSNVSIADTGNGGVYMYAGDRASLTPSGHSVAATSITRYNRYTHCYTPGIVLGGVGNAVLPGTTISDAPHQAIFSSGNNHLIDGITVSNVCRITMDAGAWYAGRDLSYRGNVIRNSVFRDINSYFPGTPVLYADDCMSSITVLNTTFLNHSGPVAASEGGKGHTFVGCYSDSSKGVHAVSKGCEGALQYLDLVPWNTSQAWAQAYPTMAAELAAGNLDSAWHLTFVNNSICGPNGTTFVDMSASSIAKLNGTDSGNVNRGPCT